MSTNLETFLAAAQSAGPLQDALRAATNPREVAAIAAAHGHAVTAAELEAHAASQPLSEEALAGVAGGIKGGTGGPKGKEGSGEGTDGGGGG